MSPRAIPLDVEPGQLPRPRSGDIQPAKDGVSLGLAAVPRAQRLAAAIRDEGPHSVALETDFLSRQELIATIVALSAMVPADVEPRRALAWIERPAREWPADILTAEAKRHDEGAEDATAVLAVVETQRRLTAMRAHLHRPAADVEGRAS